MSYPPELDEWTDQQLARELAHRADRRSYGRCDYCNQYRDEGPCKFPDRHSMALTEKERIAGVR